MKSIRIVRLLVFMTIYTVLIIPVYSRSILPSSVAAQGVICTQTNGRQLGRNQNAVFIQPLFTQAAYGNNDPQHNGFYDYYFGRCDQKCLTVTIPKIYNGSFVSSGNRISYFIILSLKY
ncbi:MAG: hypothetical protein PXX83_09595 [Candidatus Nitrosotalea sp.]|nr:hypothetical protein [Candidatus Nitrosotalea sp.]